MQIRLDKFLADAKVGSRSEVKEYIKKDVFALMTKLHKSRNEN